jgi:hypothetical protein
VRKFLQIDFGLRNPKLGLTFGKIGNTMKEYDIHLCHLRHVCNIKSLKFLYSERISELRGKAYDGYSNFTKPCSARRLAFSRRSYCPNIINGRAICGSKKLGRSKF